ncbi:hexosaminidase D-like [Tropilaelaps mercedesae]|uniref:beta-N-acetylhexosaminidase n=1 Tax=Tropilaelaps mercedesae TaxID=418985 RepID=A0A1V9X2D8_9ACAR|nr:hexosaminidase D-like [Tropilaelaps mercedesae]
MWPSRLSRLRPPTVPCHAIPTPSGSHFTGGSPGVFRRGVNFRPRVLLMLCVGVVTCILLLNLLFIKRERHFRNAALLDIPETENMESHLRREDVMLDRIRHGGRRGPVNLPEKIVHLDLKGAPLNVPYIEQVLPLLAKLGATGILIEYEDMFPYDGQLSGVSADNAYSKSDIHRILRAAKANNLGVIPLVPTFGHLEFVLKLKTFDHLREASHNPQVLCPSRNGSVELVHEMLRQVIALHRNYSTHVHIGSDEVFVLGECNLCQARMQKEQWDKDNLLISHVTSIVKFVTHLGMQPILWDDMFRRVEEETIRSSPLVKLVEIMASCRVDTWRRFVWNYSKTVNLAGVLAKYMSTGFRGVWIASAFKGASGPASQVPDLRLHLLNHYSWMQLVRQFSKKIALKGIAITGWQRFDHFGTLCELFPVGLPTLAVCLGFLQKGRVDEQVLSDVSDVLKCNMRVPVFSDSDDSLPYLSCDYPGAQVFSNIFHWMRLVEAKEQLMATNQFQGWMTDVNRKYLFSSPQHVLQCTRELPSLTMSCAQLRQSMITSLTAVTDKYTAQEWVETFLDPLQNWFEQLQKDADKILNEDAWPKRPLSKVIN